MSLLLDALKKAADDKSKKLMEDSEPESDEANSVANKDRKDNKNNHADSMELELDNSLSEASEYPDVSEATLAEIADHTTPNESTQKSTNDKFDLTQSLYSIEETLSLDSQAQSLSLENIDHSNTSEAEGTDVSNHNSHNAVHDIGLNTAPHKIKPDKIKPDNSTDTFETNDNPSSRQAASRIETEQALSALINKSNQYSRREKLKRNIGLTILISLILVASGLYFFIEMQTTSQNFYISQNDDIINRSASYTDSHTDNQAANQISRHPDNETATPIKTLSKSVPDLKSEVTPIKRVTTRQKPANSTLTKPRRNNQSWTATQAPSKSISIIHSKKVDPIHQLLSEAYSEFHAQRYRLSESLYKQVLTRESKNRDALLGLAAIGIKEKRFEYARQKYQYLLRLNPSDSYAIAGLTGIENHLDTQLSESQLKFMLKQQPDAAHLYFALGTQYSSRLKWAEAQSAYFSAWSADNKNADYCYNLAVSLDHLDKKNQALKFYQLSLKLKQASQGNFSQSDTEQRIRRLQVSAL